MFKYLFDTAPWYFRVPSLFLVWFFGAFAVLALIVGIIAIAIAMGWWGIAFVIGVIFATVIVVTSELSRREEATKKTKKTLY